MTSLYEVKDVKSNQTSSPKGKSYYIELYKGLEASLNEGGDAHERTTHLCKAWRNVHSLCQHSAPPTHTHLLYWLQRHTARAVLQTEWQTPKRKDDRKRLEEAIDAFIGQVTEAPREGDCHPWEKQLVSRGEWFKRVLDKPWDHPVLMLLLNPNGTPPTDDEVLAWLTEERGVTFVTRLHTLVGEKCDDIAVSLAHAVLVRARAALPPVVDEEEQTEAPPAEGKEPTFADRLKEEAGFTAEVWETLMDIEFVLLHKRDSKRCIALAKQTPLLDAYPLIERLQKRLQASPQEKRLWKNAREVAILIAQVVIARCMVVKSCVGAARTALYCCARFLARLLAEELPATADALAAQALTARHLHTLAQAVDKQLSPTNEDMKPYVCELYVRAITAGMNELERLKLKTEKEAEARLMEKSLASWFVQLGVVLARSDRIACECTLTAFSLHPSQKMYERIDSAPTLAPLLTDANESNELTVKSEFGSWASDSRSQTNLVKTSETLNMTQTQNQANVLSTAIFNEGEALGLSAELCQDIAVLLSGPRIKTLSWDMDRTLLLENCRAYCEVTHDGTRVLSRELKYLNIDPRNYQHLPEEKDDDENDPYYGIERGYEHLAILEEPEEIWEDANDPEKTDSASSIEKHYVVSRRKKKKKVAHTSGEDSDPLSFVAEAKRTQKKKERPHSKERSKERKKKQDPVDPLDIDGLSQNKTQTKAKKEPKEKKERKKKEKIPKVIGGKLSSHSRFVGLKVGRTKKTPVTSTDYDSQAKNSLTLLNSESYANANYDDLIPIAERKQEPKIYPGIMKSNNRPKHNMIGNKCISSHILERPPNNLTRMQYRPQTPNTVSQPVDKTMNLNYKNYPDDVKANLSRLLEFRRQRDEFQLKAMQQKNIPPASPRKPAIMRPDIPLQSNITPKSVSIPEIPKSYINKEQAEKLAEFIRVQKNANSKDSVIQYATNTHINKKTPVSSSLDSQNRAHHSNASSMKISDIVNPSYDRLMAEIAEKHRGQEVQKAAASLYQPGSSQKFAQHSQRPVYRSLNTMTQGQKDFQNFLKEYEHNKYLATTHAIDMSSKSTREVKKPIMPVSRVTPVIPSLPKPESKPLQCPKQQTQKKPEASLNTFSRLSYHKNKQNEMKNKIQTQKLSTYQEVSSELDDIILEHQLAKMKTVYSKRDNVDRLMKPANVQEPVNKNDVTMGHPLLSNLLQNSTSISSSSCYRNESPFKNNPVQQTPIAPLKTALAEKDNIDLINLLRQQNKLNNSPQYYTTNVKPSPSISKAAPVANYNSIPNQIQQQMSKTGQYSKPPSLLETKIINVISNTLLKPGQHEISKSLSINIKSHSNSSTTKPVNCTLTQNTDKKNVADYDEKKYVPESSKPEWQTVMCDLLKHKTPTRGPNALDVALNKSSFESAFEKSVKESTAFSQSLSASAERDKASIKNHEEPDRQKPLVAAIQDVIITKKGIKIQNEQKQQKDPAAAPVAHTKQRHIPTNEKKLTQEVQLRKQFTYAGPKHIDPFISGIPNSDYDLLEELMDDDLRKEIGELSSDEESYNAAAQSFLKPTKNSEKRVGVHFNKCVSEPVSDERCLYNLQCTNEMMQSVRSKPASQCVNRLAQTAREKNPSKVQQKATGKTRDGNCLMPSTSQTIPTQISSTTNAQNVAYNKVATLNQPINQIMIEPNIYISTVPQPAPLQNVVLVGQEIVYGGYSTIQTPLQNSNNLAPNAYVAVNSTPTMTLYQTTQYTNPVVIGTSMTVPVINKVSCTAFPIQPSVTDNMTKLSYAAQPLTSVADTQISMKTSDSLTEMNNKEQPTDCSQLNYKLQDENKASERKVLSEVQDFAMSENIDKIQSQIIESSVNVKNNFTADAERLKNKRLAIMNREIHHKCGETTIPLTYSPLPLKIATIVETQDFLKAMPLSKEDKSDTEQENLLAQIKNNLQDLSDAINEIPSPATPDSNDSKENDSSAEVSYRRILLRSSNKITPKPNSERIVADKPKLKKTKAKLTEISDTVTNVFDKATQDKTDAIEIGAPKRASKRLRNKKTVLATEQKPLQHLRQTLTTEAKPASISKAKSMLAKQTETLEYFDVESELQGSKISKLAIEDNIEIEKNDCTKSISCKSASIPADETREDVIPVGSLPQTFGLLEQSSQKNVSDQNNLETIEEITSNNKHISKHITDKTIQGEAINIIIEKEQHIRKTTEDMKTDEQHVLEHTSDNKNYVFNDIKQELTCSELSMTTSDKIEKNVTTADECSLSLDTNNSTNLQSLHVHSTEVPITNGDTNRTAEKCNTLETVTINIQNATNLLEKENIDLDMTVTCEEVPKQKICSTVGKIKTARNKPINTDKKKDVKACDISIIKNETNINSKNLTETDTTVPVSVNIEKSEETTYTSIENIVMEPTPNSWLVNKTTKTIQESEGSSNAQYKMPANTNTVTDLRDVVFPDNDRDTKHFVPLIEQSINENFAENNAPVQQKFFEVPIVNIVTNRVNEALEVKLGRNKAPASKALPRSSSNKSQSKSNASVNPNFGATRNLPEIPQHIKDNIRIEHLPSKDPTKNRIRVCLPNGRNVIATVRDKVHVTYDTLFAHPFIKEALLNETNHKKRYIMNVQQIVTVDKSNPSKILSAQINRIETPTSAHVPVKPVETIDLLSDEEDSGPSQIIKTSKQVFITEYGEFAALPMDKDLLIKHQTKFSQKLRILLKKVDEKSDSQVIKINAKPKTHKKKLDMTPSLPEIVSQTDIPLIPNIYVTGLINDINNKLSSKVNNTPIVVPDIVEIDDSSNDSLRQAKCAETKDKTIDKLKNVLLKELGVETVTASDRLQEQLSNDGGVEIVEKIHSPKNNSRRKTIKLSAIPSGKSCPFDDLDEEDQLRISKRKCAIKLVRCDDEKCNADVIPQSDIAINFVIDEPMTTEDFTNFLDLDEKIVETEERNSSPVIEIFDVIALLDRKSPAHIKPDVTPLSCEASWHSSKSKLHSQSVDNVLARPAINFDIDTEIKNESLIDLTIPLTYTTKEALHLQGVNGKTLVRSHLSENDKDNSEDTMIAETISPSCEAGCITTKSMLHFQEVDDVDLVRPDAFVNDYEMCNVSHIGKEIPLSCKANWLETKPMIHDAEMCDNGLNEKAIPLSCLMTPVYLQDANDTTLERSHVYEYDKVGGNSPAHEETLLTCELNCLTPISTPHLQEVTNHVLPSKVIDVDTKIYNDKVEHSVAPLSCGAQWFTTKTTLHLEAPRITLLVQSNLSTDSNEKCCDPSSMCSVDNITETMPVQTANTPYAPSLVSLVLERLRDSIVINQYISLRKLSAHSPVNLLKRSSSLPQSSAACKVSKLNATSETKCIDSNVAIETSDSDFKNTSKHILQDTKMISVPENSPAFETLISSVYSKCDNNHSLNMSGAIEEQTNDTADCGYKENLDATALKCNINICSANDKALSDSSNIPSKGSVENISSSDNRSPSPAIDTTSIIAFEKYTSIQFDKQYSQESESLSSIISVEQLPQKNTDTCNNVSEPTLETKTILDEHEDANDCDDSNTICTSAEDKISKNYNSGDLDDIEVKLAEIVGESLTDPNTVKSSRNISEISESQKSNIIRIILGEEAFVNTDSKDIEISVRNDDYFKETGMIRDVFNVTDHAHYTTLGTASVYNSTDETPEDKHEVIYVTANNFFLSDNESCIELEEEIVDMRSDEIVDDFLYDTTHINPGNPGNDSVKLSGPINGSVNLECSESISTDENYIGGQVTIKEHFEDNTLRKENEIKYEDATEDLVKKCVVTTKSGVVQQENTMEILNNENTESIINKYLTMFRNKPEMFENIVEYEDSEAGTYYVIPIVEESTQNDIESISYIENDTSIIECPKIKEQKADTVSSLHNNITSRSEKVIKSNDQSYDNIEERLAEIVGESFAEKRNRNVHKIDLDEKYKTSYSIEVETISSSEKYVGNVTCQVRETEEQDCKKSVKSVGLKSTSGTRRKKRSKHHDKSDEVIKVNDSDILKVKLPQQTYAGGEIIKTRRKILKRKIDMSVTKIDTKYRKVDQSRLAEVVDTTADNENKKKSTGKNSFDKKYATSNSLEIKGFLSHEKEIRQLRRTDVQSNQNTADNSVVSKSGYGTSLKRRSKCRPQSPHYSKANEVKIITGTENLKVNMPKHTYSKQIGTRRKSLKRKIDMTDIKISERKYRKGKNIDCPKFTVASLSETVYAKEYKTLIDYCSSVKFSFAVPFHKENIDVQNTLKSWPKINNNPITIEQSEEPNECLFAELEKSEALLDPLKQTLPEEIIRKFDENSYTPSNICETNFNMGFGERSGRVIKESQDGESTTFSAATLSDVKQLQPLLPSEEKTTHLRTNCVNDKILDQKLKAMRFVDHLNLREKVRSFFAKTKAELDMDSKQKEKIDDCDDWPFGDLTSTRSIIPPPVQIMVNVVQVGQLPVSTAAQNPITCDPRVTHVSNASPSQCSPGNSLGDELQTPIKTEYTELTTADITLPLMQEYVQHHSMPIESQEQTNLYGANDNTPMSTQLQSIVKIEVMEETSQENVEESVDYENNGQQQLPNGNVNNSVQYQFENIVNNATESYAIAAGNSSKTHNSTAATFSEDKQNHNIVEKPDQLAHAMNAAGITVTNGLSKPNNSIETMHQNAQPNVITTSQANTNNFSKGTPVTAMALQQALAQILPPPLNQTSSPENNPQTSTNSQVLHIMQGSNPQSVINKPNGTQLLHIVQNKSPANTNGTPAPQQNTFSGLSLVDGAIQQSGNQLLHIVNTSNQKNTNAGQLLKRVNLLTNLANVQGANEQKMVQFVCKSADGKSIQLPHQRSMVLRLQPLDPPNVPTTLKQNESQDHSSTSGTIHPGNEKEPSAQDMKSRSLYEENYAKFVQNDVKFAQNGDSKQGPEKATSLPKFNQVFGKQVYQDKQNDMDSTNLTENTNPPEENNPPLEQMNDITNPPMLIRKTNPTQPSHVQPNLVQQIKQTIGPMNIQTMHGGVIYTRQIPVNIGNGQTINLITVPSTELVEDSPQKQQTDAKFGNQEGDPPIIKIVPTNQPAATQNASTDDNSVSIRSTNDANPQPNPLPQPVLTQMRIKLPMLSKAPQMVGGTRVVRPSFFQIQRNVIGGANQQVYQQLVLTAAPPLGQSIRLPTQVQKPKTPSETQSSPESQMSSSTLEQLREFDMVLEQVKERSTVQPGSSASTSNNFTKLKGSPDTTDASTPSTSQESPTQVLYSVGNTQPLNMVNYVTRKSTITSTTTSSFVRSPDSTGTVESPPSSTHSHLPHTVTSDSCASSSCASEAATATAVQPKPKKKKPKPSTSNSNPFNIKNTPKPSSQKPIEDEQTTQRILYILAEYKEQVENSPDKDKPAPRRRNNPAAPNGGSSKRKKSGSRRRDMSPVQGEDSCRTMGSEDSSCGTSLGECNECLETHSPEESPKKVVRRLTFEQETQVTQTRTTTTTTTIPQRNVIVTDGQAFAVRGPAGKPATTVLMPANYLLPVSMVKGGQQIAIVTNRGPKLLVGAGEGGTGGTLLFQRLIGPGLKPMLARPGVRHIRLPTAALHNLQAFNIATTTAHVQPPDSTASPTSAPTPPDLVDTRAMSSPWPDRDAGEIKPERGNSSPEGSEPWNLPSSSIADDYGYEEIVRTDNMDRTVLDAIPDRYSPDLEAQRIFDKMFDSDSKKTMYDSRCGYDIDASDDDKAYHQVVHRKDGRHTRLTHVSAAALRHKYAILEHELRLQKSLSEECEDLGVDSPSASELFPEAELLFAPSPAHEQTIEQCHTPQPTMHVQGIPQPDLDDQIATDHLLAHKERHDDLDINLDDVGEMVTVGEDGMTTIPIDHEEFARSHEEFARSHPNTTFHSEPEDGEVAPFAIAQGIKGRQITFHSRGLPATVVMAPQTTVISQATVEATGSQNPVKFSDIDNMINAMPTPQHVHINIPSVLKAAEASDGLTKFDRLLNETRELNLSNTASVVHSIGNGTQVIRRVQYERRDSRYMVEDDAMLAGDSKMDERRNMMAGTSPDRHPELFWDAQPRPERRRFDFSSDSDKCCKSPYDTNSDSSGIGAHTRLDSVIKAARTERRSDGSSADDVHPPLRTYPPKRTHQHAHHSYHHDVDRSVTGKTRASDRCHDVKDESRRRASNRGVVKRGCHCCNGSTPPKPKKSRPKKTGDYPHN